MKVEALTPHLQISWYSDPKPGVTVTVGDSQGYIRRLDYSLDGARQLIAELQANLAAAEE